MLNPLTPSVHILKQILTAGVKDLISVLIMVRQICTKTLPIAKVL